MFCNHPHTEQDVSRCHIRNIIRILKFVNHIEVITFSMGLVDTNMRLADNTAHRQIGCVYAHVHGYLQILCSLRTCYSYVYDNVRVNIYLHAYKDVIP